jgi:hypothetical protein
LLDEIGATIEHLEAFSAGGASDLDNLATACWKCNVRKGAATLVKWDVRAKQNPVKGKYGEPQSWDGLSSMFVMLARRDPGALTTTEKRWLKALAVGAPSMESVRIRGTDGTTRPDAETSH